MLIKTARVRLLLHPRRLPGALFVAIIAIITTISLFVSIPVHAAQTIPYKINFQGRLTDASGNIKPDGKYNMRLRLYTAASSGTNVWQADRIYNTSSPTDYRVQVTNGLFSIQLGDVASGVANDPALSPSLFSSGTYLYLEVELPTTGTATCNISSCQTWTEGPMTPRSPLGSSAYAFNADTVDGIDGASLARNDASNTFGSSVTNTFNGRTVIGNTATVTNNSMLGFNIAGTSGAYTLQAAGTGTYFYSDGTMTRIGMVANGSSGGSIDPTNRDDDAITIASAGAGFVTAVNGGVGYANSLVENGGFEFALAGWHPGGTIGGFTYTEDTSSPKNGNINLKFVKASGSDAGSIYQRFHIVAPGEVYYASAWVKTSSAATGTGGIRLEFFDKAGASISTVTSTTTNPGTTYTLRTATATAPANAVSVLIQPYINTDGSAGDWYFDDIYGYRSDRVDPALFKNAVDSTTAFQIQNASGAALLVADTSGLSLKVGGGDVSPDATPALLVLDYKNTSGDPSGVNGATYYNSSSNKFRCYENSAWKDCDLSNTRRTYRYTNDLAYSFPMSNGMNIDGTIQSASSSGNLTPIQSAANHPGIVQLSASSNSGLQGFLGGSALLSSGTSTFTNILRIPTLSTSGEPFWVRSGFANAAGAATVTDGCYARVKHDNNSGKWEGVCSTSSTTSTCDMGVTPTAGAWAVVKIVAVSGSVTFTADSGTPCSITTNIPTGSFIGFTANIWKTGGFSARTVEQDFIEYVNEGISR